MSDKYSVYTQREDAELVGTLWLNHIKGRLSSAFTYAAEFSRFRKADAQKRLDDIRNAVSYWKQEAALVNAPAVEVRFIRDAFEYL